MCIQMQTHISCNQQSFSHEDAYAFSTTYILRFVTALAREQNFKGGKICSTILTNNSIASFSRDLDLWTLDPVAKVGTAKP